MIPDDLDFDVAVDRDGYVWWYLDALSDDHAHGLTVIAFIGSVFSPYYARRRRRPAGADPLDHCAINVALYGRGGNRWTMTERGRTAVTRSKTRLSIGPSSVERTAEGLRLHLDEVAVPRGGRVRGTIDVKWTARATHRVALDDGGRHWWGVIAPSARVHAALEAPRLRWEGPAYLDSNRGSVPLEKDFVGWDWSRAHRADGRTAVIYDVLRRQGEPLAIAHWFEPDGRHGTFEAPPIAPLPRTRWRLAPATRSAPGESPSVVERLEDGPFYSRSVVASTWQGERVTGVHEHLSMQRFERRWVRALLPFRMPRRGT